MAPMSPRYRLRAALLAVALLLVAGCGGSDGDGGGSATSGGGPALGPAFGSMSSLPGALKQPPPWPADNGKTLQLRLRTIGLQPLTQEGQALHIHQHLDLYVDGKRVTVPANIGIDAGGGFISALHTHQTDGIIHVESPTVQPFRLGEFFAIWGLPLSASCIGSRCATSANCVGEVCPKGGKQLRVWVNGKAVSADPTRIVLAEHQEIAIAYGTDEQMPDPVPDSFDFAAAGL
jgi:hypothetical protein